MRESRESITSIRADARSAGSDRFLTDIPGAHAPGFMLSPASQAHQANS